MRRPELAPGQCRHCYHPKAEGHEHGMCWPATADERAYGEPADDMWSGTTDRLESFVLDITHPNQNTHRGAHGFQVDEAKAVTARLRAAIADGTLTADDLGLAPATT